MTKIDLPSTVPVRTSYVFVRENVVGLCHIELVSFVQTRMADIGKLFLPCRTYNRCISYVHDDNGIATKILAIAYVRINKIIIYTAYAVSRS